MAGRVLTMRGPVIRDGGIAWRGERITAVGQRAAILKLSPRILADDPDAILMPGLINAHAHLELTCLSGRLPRRMPFTEWLMGAVQKKRGLKAAEVVRGIQSGERRLLESGVTGVVDTAGIPAALNAKRTLRSRVLQEVIGIEADVCLPASARPLSPHAPYSLSDKNLLRVARWWTRHPRATVSMHIAESREEGEYFLKACGAFENFYAALGIPPRPSPRRRVVAHLDLLRLLRPGLLAVHANDISGHEARTLARRGVVVAVCPGSLDFFGFSGRGVHRLISAHVPLVFGTDSSASNTDLNLFRELRLARKFWGLSPRSLIRSATRVAGDRFWQGRTGRLANGCFADFLLVRQTRRRHDPFLDLLTGRAEERIRLRAVGGQVAEEAAR